MNGGKSSKSPKRDSVLDKISDLPCGVMDQILCLLPIRDAIRTSVLASKWRFKWTTMSDLVFDDDEPANFIDRALCCHTDAIYKFKLVRTKPISSTDLDCWILRLSRCPIQDLKLKICQPTPYKLHSRLFSFQDLVHLKLYNCHLKLPSTFGGFKKLKSLRLDGLDMAQDAFETLISSCPILERLTLLGSEGFSRLNIDAPNLLKILFEGCFDDINLINCPKLEEVSVPYPKAGDFSNFLKFISSVPCIERLDIKSDLLKYLAAEDIPRQLLNSCTNLGYLYLEICNDEYAECSVALCLLRSSPNLQELHIVFQQSPEGKEFTFWESENKSCSFNKLQTVDIGGVAGNKNELELIRFILLASPVLQKMSIKASSSASESQALQFAIKLLRFQRASTEAKVVFKL